MVKARRWQKGIYCHISSQIKQVAIIIIESLLRGKNCQLRHVFILVTYNYFRIGMQAMGWPSDLLLAHRCSIGCRSQVGEHETELGRRDTLSINISRQASKWEHLQRDI